MGKVFKGFPMIKLKTNGTQKPLETKNPTITPEFVLCCEDF